MAGKTQELKDSISSGDVSSELLGKIKDQWFHDDFRQRVLALVVEHEGTRDFEKSVSDVVARYLKIKTSERFFWLLGLILVAIISHFWPK